MNRVNKTNWKYIISSSATLKETFAAKYDGVLPRTPLPKRVQNLKFTLLSETTSIPATFIWEFPRRITPVLLLVSLHYLSNVAASRQSKTVLGCVPLRLSGSGSVIQNHSDHGRSDQTMNLIWISCQWNLDSGFLSLAAFWNPWPEFLIPSPGFQISQAKVSGSLDSTYKTFRDDARITFHEEVGSV